MNNPLDYTGKVALVTGAAAVEIPRQIFSDTAMAIAYIGLVLIFLPLVAWLFLPRERIIMNSLRPPVSV